ncbi:cysteine--tRNA ligase [Aureibacillus halotolerans]|uniref:Cysteine--tRNA ligase n=1 Tax=Aureibacillus halotolerans TaxID=1508390 RepID=A0A4R6TQA5_9BACI|nr:cysteine--tRNA ligase [Aureibacillus halotolerans]TDQ34689.1 cysteinyl-tRNA synthetase [Aureibacillus halotolerans]
MSLHLFNSLSRKKEAFVPLEEGKVKMYVCGPTVYNYIHIGNARPPIVFDTLRRYLEFQGYDVHYVANFTDVDDKLIKAANELGEDVPTIANRFIDAYHEDVERLNVKKATTHPRVTENMEDIIAFVKALVEKDVAYESNGDVYFKTRSFDGYGKLSHQSVDALRLGSRIEVGEQKADPLDFVLWKAAKPGEISWESPWGHGRPGWHIECSAMIKKYLGDTIDIHAGGQDLIFPHHENEIAQSESITGKSFATYWLHNGYIQIDNEKMSKSLGNFVLVHDMLKKYDAQAIRFFLLSVHYRQPINLNAETIEAATNSLERIQTTYRNLQHRLEKTADLADDNVWMEKAVKAMDQFKAAMDDDMNTANAITAIFDFTREANAYIEQKNASSAVLNQFIDTFDMMAGVLGFVLQETELLDDDIEALIQERQMARKQKDYKRSDDIRDQLKAQGIDLEDTPQGVRWKRVRQ